MKTKRRYARKFIGYDKRAPTAWITLLALVFTLMTTFGYQVAVAQENYEGLGGLYIADTSISELTDLIRDKFNAEKERQEFLAELRQCESSGDDFAQGDNGDSIGPYQWQKASLEEKLGRTLTYDEYYSIATNYKKIHPITYKTYFTDGESWRWVICTKKING